jgi:NADPH:quinone reductase-like Zn-dependent oxidoreductase
VLFFKQIDLLGSTMGSSADMLRAWQEVEAGRIRPVVDRVLPMHRIAEAHLVLERREAFGKVVLSWDES